MNSILKRMFEDDDCSAEEAQLKAAILGKSYDECKQQWELEFKRDFVVNNYGSITSYSFDDNALTYSKEVQFTMQLYIYDDCLLKNLYKCSNVDVEVTNDVAYYSPVSSQHVIPMNRPSAIRVVIKFFVEEITQEMLNAINKIYNPSC